MHKSGFVNIIGNPNVGKSTLMNAMVGERMSIITAKPQTTRHRIVGILSGDDFQIIFSDTPGIIKKPVYKMQEAMNRFVKSTFEDADLMLFVTEVKEKYSEDDPIFDQLKNLTVPKFLVINKIDISDPDAVVKLIQWWNERIEFNETIPLSALEKKNTETLLKLVQDNLQEGPAYYPKDQLTDRPERFFVSEIIREKILELYHQEIPYSTEVHVESFKETKTNDDKPLVKIYAIIFVARETQKMIVLGKGGSAIKKLGMESRKALEKWLESKVFLELHVKVKDNWRDDERQLRHFGYE
ncbi:MAG: GTPase Era [Saprospiraceae bacterium]